MVEKLAAYCITATVFLACDYVWLSQIAKPFYQSRLGHLLRDNPDLGIAAAFYAVYVVGVIIFAVWPAVRAESAQMALVYGALFGFFAYATYDFTNLATLRDWPVSVVVVDILWGTFVTGLSAFIGAWTVIKIWSS